MSKFKVFFCVLIFMFTFLKSGNSDNSKTIFDFKINSIEGNELDLSKYKGKTLLIVNVASKCGFTKQYDDLQAQKEKLFYFRGCVLWRCQTSNFGAQSKKVIEHGVHAQARCRVRGWELHESDIERLEANNDAEVVLQHIPKRI